MRSHWWFALGLVAGVGASVVYVLLISKDGGAVIERTAKTGVRMGESVAHLLDTVNGAVDRMASPVEDAWHGVATAASALVLDARLPEEGDGRTGG